MSTIKLFETKQVRSLWDQDKEAWFFSIVDVIAVLTDSPKPRTYWSVLKNRLKKEGSELATNCSQLKMESADGKNYLTPPAEGVYTARHRAAGHRFAARPAVHPRCDAHSAQHEAGAPG